MPIFEYTCEDCGTAFEKLVRGSSENGVACPSCGEHHVTKQWSTFAARAQSESPAAAMPSCASGMCQTPGLCGRNN
jgi:putative FmdB family regulatory protein